MRSMKRVTKKLKQSLSILLAVAMVITCMPQTATAVMAAENEVVDTEGVDVNEVETVDVVDDAEAADDVEAVDDTEDVEEASSVEENIEEGGDDAEVEEPVQDKEDAPKEDAPVVVERQKTVEAAEVSNDGETAGTTKTFNFKSDITITDEMKAAGEELDTKGNAKKSYTYPAGTKFGTDEYFSTVGSVTLKLNDDLNASIGVEVGKAEGGAVKFTTQSKTNITLVVASTGSSNSSSVALKKVNDDGSYAAAQTVNKGTNKDGADMNVNGQDVIVVTATGNGTTLEYTNVEAGTYAVVSPEDTNNRGARIYQITVTEAGEGSGSGTGEGEGGNESGGDEVDVTEGGKTFDFINDITLTAEMKADTTYNYPDGTEFNADGFVFKTKNGGENAVALKLNSAKDKSVGVEVAKNEGSSVVFTTTSRANIKLVVASTNGTNKSSVALKKVENGAYTTAAITKDGEDVVEITGNGDSAGIPLVYTNVEAGTYAVVSPADANNRGARIYSITVKEKEAVAGEWILNSISPVTYNGEEQAPDVVVVSDGGTPVESTKYTVSYKRNGENTTDVKNVGTIAVNVVGNDTDTDKKLSVNYIINPLTLDKDNTVVTVGDLEAGTLPVTVETKLKTGEDVTATKLTVDTEYTVEITDLQGAPIEDLSAYNGTAKVKVIGKGNFKGEVTAEKSMGTGVQTLSLKLDVGSLDETTYTAAKENCENLAGSIFSLLPAQEGGDIAVDANKKALSGSLVNVTNATKRLKLGGGGSTEARAIKFTAEQNGQLSIYVMSSSGSADRKVVLVNEVGGEVVVTDVAQKSANDGDNPVLENVVNVYAGRTYYLYSPDGGINIYYMELVPKEDIPPEPSFVNISLELSKTEFVYNGSNQFPELTVKFGDTPAQPDQYTVEYFRGETPTANNYSAGTITVKVTGNEGTPCAGKFAEASYVIKKMTLTSDNSRINVITPVYEGYMPNVHVAVKHDGDYYYGAIDPANYELSYANASTGAAYANPAAIPAGTTVRVTATVTGNYEGTVTGEYNVVRKPAGMGDYGYWVTFYIGNEYYNEYEYDAGSFITIPEDVEYELEGKVVEGWYTDINYTAKSKWNFTKNIVDKNMTLYARVCSAESSDGLYVQDIPAQTYTGKDIKPAVVVYASDGKTLLKNNKDYKVTYANNKEANASPYGEGELLTGKTWATATIEGKGNYESANPIVKRFIIEQGNLDWEGGSVVVKFTDQLVPKAKAQKVLSSVKFNKKALKVGTDFNAILSAPDGTVCANDAKGNPQIPANAATGEYTLEITGINNYTGTWYEYPKVADAQKLMKNAKIKLGKNLKKMDFKTASSFSWSDAASNDAAPADDKFSVSDKSGVIDPSKYNVYTEYTGSYEGGVAVGKAQLVIEGRGGTDGYYGTKKIAFTVTGAAFAEKKGVVIDTPVDKVYTGEALYQNDLAVKVPSLTEDGKTNTLTIMDDYEISYKSNVKKGKATMTFKALPTSGYTGSIKKTFKINAATLDYNMITAGLAADSTKASPKMPNVPFSKVAPKPADKLALRMVDQNVKDNTLADGAALKAGTDYTVKYKNNNKVGVATITLKGKGSITGSLDISFNVESASLKDLYDDGVITVAVTPVKTKQGATKDYAVKLKVLDTGKALKVKTDYTLSKDKIAAADVNAYVYPADANARGDQPKVTVTGAGNYKEAIEVPLSFFDNANTLSKKNGISLTIAPAVYNNGKQVTPGVIVKLGNTELTECDETGAGDYTLTYGKNNVAGKNKGSVTVTGQGLYGGKYTEKFTILPKPLNGEIDELDSDFYYGYINDKITQYIDRAQGKVDGIGTVTYNSKTRTFTVPVTDKTVNIDGTFTKLVDKYRNDPRIDIGMEEVKDVFMADIENASEIKVTAAYANKEYTEKRDPAKYIEQYKNAGKTTIIDDMLAQYEKQINNYNKLHDTDVKTYTLDKVVGKSGSVTVTINYKTGKDPVVLTYNVQFTDATK